MLENGETRNCRLQEPACAERSPVSWGGGAWWMQAPASLKLCSCLADAQRAVAILARYRGILRSPAEQPLRASVEKVVRVFQSELFQALLGKAMPLLGAHLGLGSLKPEQPLGGGSDVQASPELYPTKTGVSSEDIVQPLGILCSPIGRRQDRKRVGALESLLTLRGRVCPPCWLRSGFSAEQSCFLAQQVRPPGSSCLTPSARKVSP